MSWPAGQVPGSVAGGGEVLTSAAYDALVSGSALVPGTSYFIPELPAMWFAQTASAVVGLSFLYNNNEYVGDQLRAGTTEVDLAAGTWASRPTSGFAAGIMYFRRMTDIGDAAGGTVMGWLGGTSTEWRLLAPLRMRKRAAGTTTTSPQYPTGTRFTLPAGFAASFSMFEVLLKVEQSDESSITTTMRLKLGAAGDANDSTILATTSNALAAGENQRTYSEFRFAIESATSVRLDGLGTVNNPGSTGTASTSVSDSAVTLAASATTADALYLGLDYTMTTSNTAMTTTLIATLYP